jgi:tetratricopeptide (TPR) repeat protein
VLVDHRDNESQSTRIGVARRVFVSALSCILFAMSLVRGQATSPPSEIVPADKMTIFNPAPNSLEGQSNLEETLSVLKHRELGLAQQLAQGFPEHEEPLVIMGNVLSRRGMTDQAIGFWDRALQKNPQRVDIYHKLAQLALEMDELERAISLWRKTTELNPEIRGAHVKMAEALMKLGKHKQAIVEIQKEIQLSGDTSVECSFLLGQAYWHLRAYDKAQESLRQTLALQPDHMDAHYNLSRVYAGLKRLPEAKQHLAEFKRLKQEQLEAGQRAHAALSSDIDCFYQSLAKLCFDTRRFHLHMNKDTKTASVLKAIMNLGKGSAVFFRRLAELYAAKRQDLEALAFYYKTIQLDPRDVSGHLNLGLLSVKLGLFNQAEPLFQKIIMLAPDEHTGYQELSRLYLRMKKNLPEARRLAQKAVTLAPSAEGFHDLGLACFVNHDPTAALEAMKRAMELDPRNPRYRDAYQLFQQKQGASK